jgi:hypothetical protein
MIEYVQLRMHQSDLLSLLRLSARIFDLWLEHQDLEHERQLCLYAASHAPARGITGEMHTNYFGHHVDSFLQHTRNQQRGCMRSA